MDPEMLKAAIRPDTVLISVMFANNEIGTLEPVGRSVQLPGSGGYCFIQMQFRHSVRFPSMWRR